MGGRVFASRSLAAGLIALSTLTGSTVLSVIVGAAGSPQQRPPAPLPDGPQILEAGAQRIRVVTVTKGLSHPWGLAFLPDGNILITERAGRLRIVRQGVLDPQPIPGVPTVHTVLVAGLMDIALHPQFAENKLVYLTYSKPGARGSTTALARGRFDGMALTDLHDVFVAEAWAPVEPRLRNGSYGSRIAFAPDSTLYMTVGDRQETVVVKDGKRAQDLTDDAGKVLRLRDDGTVPKDNPFVGRAGVRPEIYSYGHRNPEGLAINPATGVLWENEQGPAGGDELNVILPGRNYGWPIVSYGREYTGEYVLTGHKQAGMEEPLLFWAPTDIGISGMAFYTGDRFPAWKGSVFVGGMASARRLERLVFNAKGLPIRDEALLGELKQRIRDVRQGPDGLLYVLTDEEAGALLRIEPVQ
jgi:glucose/arabinose dehydrogenase